MGDQYHRCAHQKNESPAGSWNGAISHIERQQRSSFVWRRRVRPESQPRHDIVGQFTHLPTFGEADDDHEHGGTFILALPHSAEGSAIRNFRTASASRSRAFWLVRIACGRKSNAPALH
jgi:hypothetical protein